MASETFQSFQFEQYLSGIFSICPVIFLLQAPVMEQHSPTRSSSTPGLTDPSRGKGEGEGGMFNCCLIIILLSRALPMVSSLIGPQYHEDQFWTFSQSAPEHETNDFDVKKVPTFSEDFEVGARFCVGKYPTHGRDLTK